LSRSIHTLRDDIYSLVKTRGWWTDELRTEYSAEVALRLQDRFNQPDRKPSLRMSKLGPQCPHALWHSIHKPELAEPLPARAEIIFTYGHMLEALVIALAKASGHLVTGEQDELVVDGVVGHRDCVLDGCICDVKSVTNMGFQKYEDGSLWEDDLFGYLDQLDAYAVGSLEDPLVTVKDKAYIVAINKEKGNIAVYEHTVRAASIVDRIARYKEIVGLSAPPDCDCEIVVDGESGNLKLGTRASYSPFKFVCHPHLRTCIGSGAPRYFTKVVKWPSYRGVPLTEVDKYGNFVN
jgi:hypothetical protein